MKLRNLRMERSPKLMIIPMIDIIFFLLVFFMMSTLYMTEQNVIPVSLPSAAASKNDKEAMIPITVTAQGTIMVYQEDIPRELLAARVKKELMQKEDAACIIRADRKVDYGKVVDVMDELKLAGIKRVAVATERKP